MEFQLVRTDRNGTKYFEGFCRCGKCGGTGKVDFQPDNGMCYDCKGSGKIFQAWSERTPEYQAILDERRRKREAKQAEERKARLPEIRKEWFRKHGYTPEGKTYLFLGKTYDKKEEIASLGGKFSVILGWHIDHKVDGFDFLEIDVNEVCTEFDGEYKYKVNSNEVYGWRKAEERRLANVPESNWMGEVGEKIKQKLKYLFTIVFETEYCFGYRRTETKFIHKFVDEAGNIFVWKTGNGIECQSGTMLEVKGTIKDHDTYNGEKQTILTRCKVEVP